MNMLIASRVIQGVGGGGIMGLVNIIMADITSLRYPPLTQGDRLTVGIARNGLQVSVRRGLLLRPRAP